ncbi:s-adenosyl-l-methionine-dependent methyltransferase [Trichoderma arundinaceum]|uniref:catechol O-methyltransferase n=1 Tax=Trichoderma arundinaceum TaxID=490622 RepID=A0A395NC89_TRIAR|nr:s-adenosyl-l-methionine-dependent methyltransferase [Trichoderma arundinaceum]
MDHPPEIAALLEKYPSLRKPIETGVESHDGREERLLSFILSHPDIDSIRGSPSKLLSAIDDFSAKHDFLISVGGHKAKILSDLVAKEKPQILVELGGYLGYSAILFADAMRRNGLPDQQLRVLSLEMSAEFSSIARELIQLAGLSDIVTVITGPAEESLRKLQKEGNLTNVDFLFLDHVEALYVTDFKVCEELGFLQKGAVIAADNVVRPGAPEYRTLVRNHPRLQSTGVIGLIQPGDLEDEIEVSYVTS